MAKTTKKVKKEISRNVLIAVAITSVLLNMFFLIGLVVYSSTNKFDSALLVESTKRYCDNYTTNMNMVEYFSTPNGIAPDEAAHSITCKQGEFFPYYSNAVNDYLRDLGY